MTGKKRQCLQYLAFALWALAMAIIFGAFGQDPNLRYIAGAAVIGFLAIIFLFYNPRPFALWPRSNSPSEAQEEWKTWAQAATNKYLFYFTLGGFVALFGVVAGLFAIDKGLLGNLDKSYLLFAAFCAIAVIVITRMMRFLIHKQ